MMLEPQSSPVPTSPLTRQQIAAAHARKFIGKPKNNPFAPTGLQQCSSLLSITHKTALGLGEDFKTAVNKQLRSRAAVAISNLAKAWCSLQDTKRELLGRPKVRSVAAGEIKEFRMKSKSRRRSQEPPWEQLPAFVESPDTPGEQTTRHPGQEQPATNPPAACGTGQADKFSPA